jgi:hypothetical protein
MVLIIAYPSLRSLGAMSEDGLVSSSAMLVAFATEFASA